MVGEKLRITQGVQKEVAYFSDAPIRATGCFPLAASALGWLLTKSAAMTRNATKYSEVPVKSYQRTVDFKLGDGEPVARQQRAIEQWDQRSPIGLAHAPLPPGSSACFHTKRGFVGAHCIWHCT